MQCKVTLSGYESTLPRLRLEEARHQALRREEAQHVPVPVPDPRGHRRGHRLQVQSVLRRSLRVVPRCADLGCRYEDGNDYLL